MNVTDAMLVSIGEQSGQLHNRPPTCVLCVHTFTEYHCKSPCGALLALEICEPLDLGNML